ncbi:MAG: hypothetical protein IPJ65_30290 [Archangiaceae bacterium]|nr:hypothetical protein [Archangiaceae bacterium]
MKRTHLALSSALLLACGAPTALDLGPLDAGAAGGTAAADGVGGGGDVGPGTAGGSSAGGTSGGGTAGSAGGTAQPVDAGSAQQPTVACSPTSAGFIHRAVSLAVPNGWLLACESAELADGGQRFAGRRTWRVLYKSSVLLHQDGGTLEVPVALSGNAVVPVAAAAGPRPVLANTHGTTGVVPQCAPSTAVQLDAHVMFDQVSPASAPGAVVVVPDFLGLGRDDGLRSPDVNARVTDPLAVWQQLQPMRDVSHPYLSIEGEGRATIDLVRAARALPDADLGPRPRWAALGVSQGGHAALATGETWTRGYGTDTELVGVMAGAPGSDLASNGYTVPELARILTPMVLVGLSLENRDLHPIDLLSSQALGAFGRTAGRGCLSFDAIDDWVSTFSLALAPNHPTLRVDPLSVPAAAAALRANSPGNAPTRVPMFIGQVTGDPFIDPHRTAALVALERAQNPSGVTACVYPGNDLGAPWFARGANHDAFRWMFGTGTGSCTGPDGGTAATSAQAFVRAVFAP